MVLCITEVEFDDYYPLGVLVAFDNKSLNWTLGFKIIREETVPPANFLNSMKGWKSLSLIIAT